MSEGSENPARVEQPKTPQELNGEFKGLISMFQVHALTPFTGEQNEKGELIVDPKLLELSRKRNQGELKALLFARIESFEPHMKIPRALIPDLYRNLEVAYRFGVRRQPEESIESNLRSKPGLYALSIYADAEHPESGGIFDKERAKKIGGRIRKEFGNRLIDKARRLFP